MFFNYERNGKNTQLFYNTFEKNDSDNKKMERKLRLVRLGRKIS